MAGEPFLPGWSGDLKGIPVMCGATEYPVLYGGGGVPGEGYW